MTLYRWLELAVFIIGFGSLAVCLTALGSLTFRWLRRRWYRRQVMNLIRRDAEKAMARKALERQS